MIQKPLRYALIGATGIGAYHLAAIQELEKEGSVKLVAAVDPALDRLADLRGILTDSGVSCHLDYRELLARGLDFDVVVISVPIPFHLEMTLAFLERDVFIYLEKPPVPLIQQLDAMIKADKRSRVAVGFQMIQASWIQKLKRAILQGELGKLRAIRMGCCWPRLDNYYRRNISRGKMSVNGQPVFDGPATNALAHLIHNAMFLAGATQAEFDAPVEMVGELYRARPIESYDVVGLRGKFRSGVSFSAALTHATQETLPYRIEVIGTEGSASVSNDGMSFTSSFPCEIESPEDFERLVDKTHRQFLSFARGDVQRPATSLLDARGYLLATNGMLLSSGKIHAIDPEYLHQYAQGDEGGYNVVGLHEAVISSIKTGALFSELDLPWAVKTLPVSVENLSCLDFPCHSGAEEHSVSIPDEIPLTPVR